MKVKIITLSILCLLLFLSYLGLMNGTVTKEIILKEWVPSAITPVIAGLFLMLLVPWANHKYWEVRTQNERKWADEKFKKETISNTAEFIEGAFFYMERLSELNIEKKVEESKLPSTNIPSELREEVYHIKRLKIQNEMGIGKMTRLIELYFPKSANKLSEWIDLCNKERSQCRHDFTEHHPLVIKTKEMLESLRREAEYCVKK